MTKIVFKTHGDQLDYANDLHVLTFAEQGFAPLDIHGRRLGVSRDTLIAFADAVNQAGQVGSLFPQAPISAVPRSCIRDTMDPKHLLRHLREFITINADHMKAQSLVLDFSTPRLQPYVLDAIRAVQGSLVSLDIRDVVIIRN